MMREGYGTACLQGEPQSGHRVADTRGSPVMKVICRCVPVLPHESSSSTLTQKSCYASNITWAVDNRPGEGAKE